MWQQGIYVAYEADQGGRHKAENRANRETLREQRPAAQLPA
jgi:hypothetical protein